MPNELPVWKEKCPDCTSCQKCSETRCRVCRKGGTKALEGGLASGFTYGEYLDWKQRTPGREQEKGAQADPWAGP